jgi:hypothetical protein
MVTDTDMTGSTVAESVAVGPVAAPANLVRPAITGTRKVGSTLTGTDGTWVGTPTLTREWRRDGVAISGATGSTYTLTPADDLTEITLAVTPFGIEAAAAVSDAAPIKAPAPVNVTPAAIAGVFISGSTLTAVQGVWQYMDTATASFTYEWRSSPHGAGTWTVIGTGTTYVLTGAEEGLDIDLLEHAHNSGSS